MNLTDVFDSSEQQLQDVDLDNPNDNPNDNPLENSQDFTRRRSSATSKGTRRASTLQLRSTEDAQGFTVRPPIPSVDHQFDNSYSSLVEVFQDEDTNSGHTREPPPSLLTRQDPHSNLQLLLRGAAATDESSDNLRSELFQQQQKYKPSSKALIDKEQNTSFKTAAESDDDNTMERPFLEPSPNDKPHKPYKKSVMAQVCRSLSRNLLCYSKSNINYCKNSNQQTDSAELDILGVSVYHLKHVFLDQCIQYAASVGANNTRSFKVYDIENLSGPPGVIRQCGANAVCPIDGRMGAAYVHCLKGRDHVGEATHMLSYSWSYTIGDIVDTLTDFCHSNGLDSKRTYIWICCLCVNQHRVVEGAALKETGVIMPAKPQVDFFALFGERVKRIGHLLAMMAPWKAPVYLTRVWCIYELFTAHTNGCVVDIIMPPKEKDSLEQDLLANGGGIDMLYDTLGNTKVQNACASVEQDRQTILEMIESSVGYHVLNSQVNDLLRSWVKQVIRQLVVTQTDTNDEGYVDFCNKVGSILCENGEHNAALDLHRKALDICISVLGNHDHKQSAISHFGIGDALCAKGDYDGALEELNVGLRLLEKLLGDDQHPDIAKFLDRIGAVLYYLGDYDGALEMYPRCLTIQEKALGSNHPDTATSYYNIGWVLEAKGYSQGALDFYQKSRSIREKILGTNHPDTASSYKSVGSALQAEGDHHRALEYYEKCLGIQESLLGRDHPGTASTYNRIGGVKEAEGDYDGALEQYQKCRVIRESVLGRNHPDTTTIYYKIGQILQKSRIRSSTRSQPQ
eukprot:Sro1414_g270680.2  (796) ;mRNA; r:19356-21743